MKNNMDDKILEFVYILAMREATLQQAYKGVKKEFTERESSIVKPVIVSLKKHVDLVMSKELSVDEYDNSFYKTATEICDIINYKTTENDIFTFGNAQKLINMTMKYLYIMCYQDSDKSNQFKNCHCPMDSILLKHVYDKSKKGELNMNLCPYFKRPWGNEGKRDKKTKYGFSGIERYLLFQKAVKELSESEDISPLEYDYIFWLKK